MAASTASATASAPLSTFSASARPSSAGSTAAEPLAPGRVGADGQQGWALHASILGEGDRGVLHLDARPVECRWTGPSPGGYPFR